MMSATATGDANPKESGGGGRVMKPCEIPIYGFQKQRTAAAAKEAEEEPAAGAIRSGIRTARLALQEVAGPLRAFEEGAKNIYETGKAHSASTYDQLLQPENAPMRAAFIGTGGLLGYIMGAIRGRFFRKLFYSGIGLAATSAVCYPQEANQLSSGALEEGKKFASIAENFVKGAQPDAASAAADAAAAEKVEKKSTTTEKKKGGGDTSNQSNPADKDLYTTRDGDK